MSISQLFFNQGNFIDNIELDVIINESASSTTTATKNPVSKGADTTDHIIIEPMSFSCTGLVSDTPADIIKITKGIFKGTGYSISATTWEKLLKLQASRQTFTLVQNLKSYDNIYISSLNTQQDKDTSNVLLFNCQMEEILFVGQDEVNAQKITEQSVYDKAVELSNEGRKNLL